MSLIIIYFMFCFITLYICYYFQLLSPFSQFFLFFSILSQLIFFLYVEYFSHGNFAFHKLYPHFFLLVGFVILLSFLYVIYYFIFVCYNKYLYTESKICGLVSLFFGMFLLIFVWLLVSNWTFEIVVY
jgi:hypothetical protein